MDESYHKARKQFALFSAILISWEYVGISLRQNFVTKCLDISLLNVPITLCNPELLKTFIFALVIYFAFRFTIAWQSCIANNDLQSITRLRADPEAENIALNSIAEKKRKTFSGIDILMAYLIGLFSIILFLFPDLTSADSLKMFLLDYFAIGIAFYALIYFAFFTIFKSRLFNDKINKFYHSLICLGISGIAISALIYKINNYTGSHVFSSAFGIAVGFVIMLIINIKLKALKDKIK